MFKFAVCDDETLYTDKVEKEIKLFCSRESIMNSVTVYHKSEELLYDLEENTYYDILLLDIEMPGINGMELAKCAKKFLPDAIIMFITSHLKYAVDSFELSIFRYIPKILIQERLPLALKDAVNLKLLQDNQNYILYSSKRYQKLPFKDIIYIYKEQKNAVFSLESEIIKVRKSLEKIFEELNSGDFIFIERGYIVNIIHVMRIENNHVILRDDTHLPISNSHLQDVKNRISVYWGKHI